MVNGCQCLGEIHCFKSSSTLTMDVPASSETRVPVYQINTKTTILINMETSKSQVRNCSPEVSTKSLPRHERCHFTAFRCDVMNYAVITAILLFNACYPTQTMIWNFIKIHRNSNLCHFFPVFSVCLRRLMNRHTFADSGDFNYNGKYIKEAWWTNRRKDLGESRVEL